MVPAHLDDLSPFSVTKHKLDMEIKQKIVTPSTLHSEYLNKIRLKILYLNNKKNKITLKVKMLIKK